MENEKIYLGDSVYIEKKGCDWILTVEYLWEEEPMHMVILQTDILGRLIKTTQEGENGTKIIG